jgi:glycosyltransferase involved in cell wall biosynthesis
MISILAVNHNTLEWAKLLVASVRASRSLVPVEIHVVDNCSTDGSAQPDVFAYLFPSNVGHGRALDWGVRKITGRFTLVLDIDAHIMRPGWAEELIKFYQIAANGGTRLIAAKGGEPDEPARKPIHPCVMFFETRFIKERQILFAAGNGYDVGRRAYYDVFDAGFDVHRLPAGYESRGEKFYHRVFGTVYYIYGKATFYHNWYSARMLGKAAVDGYSQGQFLKDKAALFENPLIREILRHVE